MCKILVVITSCVLATLVKGQIGDAEVTRFQPGSVTWDGGHVISSPEVKRFIRFANPDPKLLRVSNSAPLVQNVWIDESNDDDDDDDEGSPRSSPPKKAQLSKADAFMDPTTTPYDKFVATPLTTTARAVNNWRISTPKPYMSPAASAAQAVRDFYQETGDEELDVNQIDKKRTFQVIIQDGHAKIVNDSWGGTLKKPKLSVGSLDSVTTKPESWRTVVFDQPPVPKVQPITTPKSIRLSPSRESPMLPTFRARISSPIESQVRDRPTNVGAQETASSYNVPSNLAATTRQRYEPVRPRPSYRAPQQPSSYDFQPYSYPNFAASRQATSRNQMPNRNRYGYNPYAGSSGESRPYAGSRVPVGTGYGSDENETIYDDFTATRQRFGSAPGEKEFVINPADQKSMKAMEDYLARFQNPNPTEPDEVTSGYPDEEDTDKDGTDWSDSLPWTRDNFQASPGQRYYEAPQQWAYSSYQPSLQQYPGNRPRQNQNRPNFRRPPSRKLKRHNVNFPDNFELDNDKSQESVSAVGREMYVCHLNTPSGYEICHTTCRARGHTVSCSGMYCYCTKPRLVADDKSMTCGPNSDYGLNSCRYTCLREDLIYCDQSKCYCTFQQTSDLREVTTTSPLFNYNTVDNYVYCGTINERRMCHDLCAELGHVICDEHRCYCERNEHTEDV